MCEGGYSAPSASRFHLVSIAGDSTNAPVIGDPAIPATMRDLAEPSDGLEPSTPSLPWRSRGGTGGHARAQVDTFFLQIRPVRRVARVRACPRVLDLMYPSRTRMDVVCLETAWRCLFGNTD